MVKDVIAANEKVALNEKEIAVLKEHFPTCFKSDGSFDLLRFSEFLKNESLMVHSIYCVFQNF